MPDVDAEQAIAREDLCRFLAACHYEPAVEFTEERLFESMLAAAQRLDPRLAELARRLADDFAAQDLQALLVDYTRLFVGPMQPLAPPQGAYWLGGEAALMQDSTLDALYLYEQGGFELDEAFREMPDHVAVELEFLYVLAFKQNEARREGLPEVLASWEQLERKFVPSHLGAWVGPFAAAVRAGAQTAFYRDLAEMTERFVRHLQSRGTNTP